MGKNNIIIAAAVLALIIILISVIALRQNKTADKTVIKTETELEVIPTVDSSVKVALQAKNNKRAVELIISGIPASTSSIDYSISYQTKQQGLQGIIGVMKVKEGEKEKTFERELGTCSSGRCVYHEVEGNIKVELKFSGKYGERVFEKEYEL